MTSTSLGELERQFRPLAEKLDGLTRQVPSDGGVPAFRLAALVGDAAHLVSFLLKNFDEGQIGVARHHLQILHDVAERLTTTTRSALADCDARLPKLHGHCLAKVQLGDAEREWLRFRPYAANEVPAILPCELEAEHPGPHAANGQMGDEIQWWVHWTLLASEITRHQPCEADQANTDPEDMNDRDLCLLYAGHPGQHSFAIGV